MKKRKMGQEKGEVRKMKKEGGTEGERKGGQERKRKKRKLLLIAALLAVVGVGAIAGQPYYKGWHEKYEKWKEERKKEKELEEGIKELKSIQENGNIPLGKTLEEVKELIDLSEYRQEKDRSGESIDFYAPNEGDSIYSDLRYGFYQNPSILGQFILGDVDIYGKEYDYLEVYGIRVGGGLKEARKELERRGYQMIYVTIEGKEVNTLGDEYMDKIHYKKGGIEVLIQIGGKDDIYSILWGVDLETIAESQKREERER